MPAPREPGQAGRDTARPEAQDPMRVERGRSDDVQVLPDGSAVLIA